MTKYYRGSTVVCQITVTNVDGNLETPASMPLTIYEPDGTLNTTKVIGDLTLISTGIYTYDFPIPTDADYGDWRYQYIPTNIDGDTSIISKSFFVDEIDTKLYCSIMDVYRKSGITNDVVGENDVADYIAESVGEINSLYQRSFGNAQSKTQWIDIEDLDEDAEITTLFLDYRPVQAITSMVSYDTSDTSMVTWTADDYWIDLDTGIIRLRTKRFSHQNNRVKVIYTYGYATVPTNIKNLAATICAMRILLQQMGGTYDDVTSYSLPSGVSIGVGEPYMNMTRAFEKLEKEKNNLIKNIGQLRTTVLVI